MTAAAHRDDRRSDAACLSAAAVQRGRAPVTLWVSTTQRHGGDIDLGTWSYRSTGYAVTSGATEMFGAAGGWEVARSLLGTVRIRVTSSAGAGPVFVGIARAGAASHYLSGVRYNTVRGIAHHHASYIGHRGGAPVIVPGRAGIWAVQTAGPGHPDTSLACQ